MTLSPIEQELVAIGASVGAGCHPCLEYHMAEGARVGLRAADLSQALADAECVKRSAYNELAVRGRELLGESAELPPSCCDETSVMKEFVSVGSAIGANSIAQMNKHFDQARGVGISNGQLSLAIAIARNVQKHAGENTEREADLANQPVSVANAPIFLTATPSHAASEESCGADCACNSEENVFMAQAACGCGSDEKIAESANCASQAAEPVLAGAKAGKCC